MQHKGPIVINHQQDRSLSPPCRVQHERSKHNEDSSMQAVGDASGHQQRPWQSTKPRCHVHPSHDATRVRARTHVAGIPNSHFDIFSVHLIVWFLSHSDSTLPTCPETLNYSGYCKTVHALDTHTVAVRMLTQYMIDMAFCLELLVLCGLRADWGPPAAPLLLAWILHAVCALGSARSRAQASALGLHRTCYSEHTAVAPAAILTAAGRVGATPLKHWLPCPAVLYILARFWHAGKVRLSLGQVCQT